MKELAWNVIRFNMDTRKIESFNIFEHPGFMADIKALLKKNDTKDRFAEDLRKSLLYHFRCKSEWEMIIAPWPRARDGHDVKVDVAWQIMNNWTLFVDYVWDARAKAKTKNHKPKPYFESSLSMEEIESNFKDVDVFSGIMEGLTEAIAYERGELIGGVVVRRRSISDNEPTSSKEVKWGDPQGEEVW